MNEHLGKYNKKMDEYYACITFLWTKVGWLATLL